MVAVNNGFAETAIKRASTTKNSIDSTWFGMDDLMISITHEIFSIDVLSPSANNTKQITSKGKYCIFNTKNNTSKENIAESSTGGSMAVSCLISKHPGK